MDRKIGIAQIGIGYWGNNLLRNLALLPDAHLVKVCDQRTALLDRVAGTHPAVERTSRWQDLLDDDRVEAIVIATQTETHFDLAASALRAGKHVLVEKPMTRTRGEAAELLRIAEGEGRVLMVGHLLLYHPAFVHVEQLIRQGALGDIYYLYSVRVNLGIVRSTESALESLGPHDLAVALQYLQAPPVAVSAQGHDYLQKGVPDVVFATVYFGDGKLAHLHTSWLDPHKIRKVTVVGSLQMAVIDDVSDSEKVRLYDKGVGVRADEPHFADYADAMKVRSGDIRIPHIELAEPLRLECAHFVECVRSGRRPRSDARQGLMVMSILDAARRSLENRGASIEIDAIDGF